MCMLGLSFIGLNNTIADAYTMDDLFSGNMVQFHYKNNDFAYILPNKFGVEKTSFTSQGTFTFKKVNAEGQVVFEQEINPSTLRFGDKDFDVLTEGDTIVVTSSDETTITNNLDVSKYNQESGNKHVYKVTNGALVEQTEQARLCIEKLNGLFTNKSENELVADLNPSTIQLLKQQIEAQPAQMMCWDDNTNKWLSKDEVQNKLAKVIDLGHFENVDSGDSKVSELIDEAKNNVELLFENSTHSMIKEGLTQEELNGAFESINKIEDSETNKSLLNEYNKALTLFQQLNEAEKVTYELFSNKEHTELTTKITSYDEMSYAYSHAYDVVHSLPNSNQKTHLLQLLDSLDNQIKENFTYVQFSDNKLKVAFNEVLGKNKNSDILIKELKGLSGHVNLSNKGITSLEGIQYCTGVTSFDLSNNKINAIAENTLSKLTQLKGLNLRGNGIADIHSLKALTHLEKLDLTKQIHSIYQSQSDPNFIDTKTILNPLKDSNNKVIPVQQYNIEYRKGYSTKKYPVTYDRKANQIHWEHDAFNNKCYNPLQPIVLFQEYVTIGKATSDFTGAFYLRNSYPDDYRDKIIYSNLTHPTDGLLKNY